MPHRSERLVILTVFIAITFMLSIPMKGSCQPVLKICKPAFTVENDYAVYSVGTDGSNLGLIDKKSRANFLQPGSNFAWVRSAGRIVPSSSVSCSNGIATVQFGETGISAKIKVTAEPHYFTVEVLSLNGKNADELVFAHAPLTLKGTHSETFAACALALNLRTNVPMIPQASSLLEAHCYKRFGFVGSRVALIACPQSRLNGVMREVVSSAPDLPHSPLGGPWAVDSPANRESYLLNTSGVTEENVDSWIALMQRLGFKQIDMQGGKIFRFGDFQLDPVMYPKGISSLKAVIDRFHSAGIKVGLHTYSFFLDKTSKWITPVPDPRLAKDAEFTLSHDLSAVATTVPVVEPTEAMSTVTGFHIDNSIALQVDDELITYTGISKNPPYAFLGCTRGAYGTKAVSHGRGARVSHLKECFGRFLPDGDSGLFTEIADETADFYNLCGFDMIYLDALDGEELVAGPENGWYYGSLFTFEVSKHLSKPAIMEMSTFHHHLWYVRSRYGAWDSPSRGYKSFVDIHTAKNITSRRDFLPTQLGWWEIMTSTGSQTETMFPDDIEYLCCKSLATDSGLSIAITPDELAKQPNVERYSDILRRYERLRLSNYFTDDVKAELAVPGREFTLIEDTTKPKDMRWSLLPVQYEKHKVDMSMKSSRDWRVNNSFGKQPVELRIEALMSPLSYDNPKSAVLVDFRNPSSFTDRTSAPEVVADLASSTNQVKEGSASGLFTARNDSAERPGSWTKVGETFSPAIKCSGDIGLGVWIYGDGHGETLNFQLQSPKSASAAISDHYVVVDFTGWRYYSLVEPESDRVLDYIWQYSSPVNFRFAPIYLFRLDTRNLQSISLWYNNLPPKGSAGCYLSPIKATPLVTGYVKNPSVTIGGKTITFPVSIQSGSYLEFKSMTDCKLYDVHGRLLKEVTPEGSVPIVDSGDNSVHFDAGNNSSVISRANVTIITRGTNALRPKKKTVTDNYR